MELRAGYKQTEVGVIPEEWEVWTFADLFNVLRTANNARSDLTDDGEIGYIHYGDVHTHPSAFLDCSSELRSFISVDKVATTPPLVDGDLVMVDASEDYTGIGKSVELTNLGGRKAVAGLHTLLLRGKNHLLANGFKGYLQYLPSVRAALVRLAVGVSVYGISKSSVRTIALAIARLPEQRAIAAALGDVDALLGAMEKLIAKKRDLKQAAMQRLLTGHQRLPGFRGEWEVRRLGDLVEIIPGGIYGEEKPREGLSAFRVATTTHIDETDAWNGKEMSLRYFSQEQIYKHSPLPGDLIVVKSSGSAEKIQSGKIGRIGEAEAGRFVFSNFLMLLRPRAIASRFLFYFLTSFNVKKLLPTLVEASTYPNIRIDKYLALEIPLPTESEQSAIAAVLSDIDAELAALEARLTKTRTLKQGMMQELLTGSTRLV